MTISDLYNETELHKEFRRCAKKDKLSLTVASVLLDQHLDEELGRVWKAALYFPEQLFVQYFKDKAALEQFQLDLFKRVTRAYNWAGHARAKFAADKLEWEKKKL